MSCVPYGAYSGDGGPATLAELNLPVDVCFDGLGNMYIADSENACIRKVPYTVSIGINEAELSATYINIYPQPAKDLINISLNYFYEPLIEIKITDVTGKLMRNESLEVRNGNTSFNTNEFPNGVYLLQIISKNQIAQKRLIIAK